MKNPPLLFVKDLRVSLEKKEKKLPILQDIELSIYPGEKIGLVGESGSGKSMLAYSILGILPPSISIEKGEIWFQGKNLIHSWEKYRGKEIAIIFQEPSSALNPVFPIGKQIEEVIKRHLPSLSPSERKEYILELLAKVGMDSPQKRFYSYPFELSGGMKQRALIAMALAGKPSLLIADEPTTALDVSIQREVMITLLEIVEEEKMAMLFITHDIALLSQFANRIYVLYAGKIVEEGEKEEILSSPAHPYTKALLSSLPGESKKLLPIPGRPPSLEEIPPIGCAFQARCPYQKESLCNNNIPRKKISPSHSYLCIL